MKNEPVLCISFGGGENSFAMVLRFYELGVRPHAILFADTGGELPETYAEVEKLEKWLAEKEFTPITRVQHKKGITLEQDCIKSGTLPSLAYGFRRCSDHFKVRPMDAWCKQDNTCKESWARDEKVIKAIGYDYSEGHRPRIREDKWFQYIYPLYDWTWDRAKCEEINRKYGFTPGKSACFFCPANRKHEILWLRDNHPELFKRALAIEENAELVSIKGLGRNWSWKELSEADEKQCKLFGDVYKERGCMCHE